MKDCILAIDQGTTSSRAIVFDTQANIITVAQEEFPQHFPADGWVEHDPEDIWSSTLNVCSQAITQARELGAKIKTIGITNQRETTIVWNKKTGKAIHNAIVWQDRRTASICDELQTQGHADTIRQKTGLLLDPYFSATKVAWILDKVKGSRELADKGDLAFGTVDSFLIWRLTNGNVHATDVTNASRTNLYNIHDLTWDDELLNIFNVPQSVLPEVKQCADDFGSTDLFGEAIPINGVAGDQQAASIGQCCFAKGDIKSTYGTGCFVLLNTGQEAFESKNKLLTTIAYQANGETIYALEGSIFIAGAAVQWLRDGIKVIERASQTEGMAKSLEEDHGVYLVPAFSGMGAPYWQPNARGAMFGLTRGTGQEHMARAALESVCYQTTDLLHAMEQDGVTPNAIKVDGGMVGNSWVCQFLSDILAIPVQRPKVLETTALGAAYMAGLYTGIYSSLDELAKNNQIETEFLPVMESKKRNHLVAGWQRAIKSTLGFMSE